MKVGLSIVAATLVLFAMSSCKECKDCNIHTIVIESGDTTVNTMETQEFCNTNLENVEDLKEGNPATIETPLSDPDKIVIKTYDCP